MTSDRSVVTTLNQRIESLERALQNTMPNAAPAPAATTTTPPISSTTTATTPASNGSVLDAEGEPQFSAKTESSGTGEGTFHFHIASTRHTNMVLAWLGKELRALRNFSIGHFNDRGELGADSPVVHALTELDGALTDMGTMHDTMRDEDPKSFLSKDQAKQAIQGEAPALSPVPALTCLGALESLQGEFFTALLDVEFLMSLPDVINSPHVRIEPAIRLIYYNLIFHGSVIGESRQQVVARGLYLQCLEAVPLWQASATGTLLDLISTALMTFTTAISFDFDLAARFHTQACHFAKQLNLHRLDALSAVGVRDSELSAQRLGIWGLVLTDLFFRFFAGKESSLSKEVSMSQVGSVDIVDVIGSRPRAARTIVQIVWGRVIFIAKEFFDHFDRIRETEAGKSTKEFQDKVDVLCDEIEEMIEDWHLVSYPESGIRNPELIGRF